jgi:hypothetical protein
MKIGPYVDNRSYSANGAIGGTANMALMMTCFSWYLDT